MWAVIPRIALWGRQIEADLTVRGIDIGWWHRFTLTGEGVPRLSSRRLLIVLDEFGEDTAYKTVLRDGQWPLWQRMLKTVANETSLHRASLYAGGDNAYSPMLFVDPLEQQEQWEQQQAEQDLSEAVHDDLSRRWNWS